MGFFPGFGVWINQNIQQLLKAESKTPGNVKSSSVSEKDTNTHAPWFWNPHEDPKEKVDAMKLDHVKKMPLYGVDPKYYDLAEVNRQAQLWTDLNKTHPWYDAPAKLKVKTKNGVCHIKMEYTLGWPPQAVEEMLTNPRSFFFFKTFDTLDSQFRTRLDNKSTKILKKDGPRQITQVEKTLRWKILGLTLAVPIHLIIDENHQTLTAKYKKDKMKYMKVLEGSWKVEPIFVDQERLCKTRARISEKEYKKCSGGQGRIGSNVTMEQIFQPSPLLISHRFLGLSVKSPSRPPKICSKILDNLLFACTKLQARYENG